VCPRAVAARKKKVDNIIKVERTADEVKVRLQVARREIKRGAKYQISAGRHLTFTQPI
jgi:hypothetical protein